MAAMAGSEPDAGAYVNKWQSRAKSFCPPFGPDFAAVDAERANGLTRSPPIFLPCIDSSEIDVEDTVRICYTDSGQLLLQILGQSRETLTAEHHLGMAEAGPLQPEPIQHVVRRLATNRHPQRVHVGEFGDAGAAVNLGLRKNHRRAGAVLRLPVANSAFQSSADAGQQFRMIFHQIVEHHVQLNARGAPKKRNHLRVKDSG